MFSPCEVGQVLMPHPRAVKNPEAEQGAWHTWFSKLTCPHRRPQPPVLTAHIVLSATAVMLVSAWGPGKWLAMRIAAFVSQKVGLGRGGPCLGMRERDTADQTAAPRLPERGRLDMQGLEWTRSGVTSGPRCPWPRGPPGGEGSPKPGELESTARNLLKALQDWRGTRERHCACVQCGQPGLTLHLLLALFNRLTGADQAAERH